MASDVVPTESEPTDVVPTESEPTVGERGVAAAGAGESLAEAPASETASSGAGTASRGAGAASGRKRSRGQQGSRTDPARPKKSREPGDEAAAGPGSGAEGEHVASEHVGAAHPAEPGAVEVQAPVTTEPAEPGTEKAKARPKKTRKRAAAPAPQDGVDTDDSAVVEPSVGTRARVRSRRAIAPAAKTTTVADESAAELDEDVTGQAATDADEASPGLPEATAEPGETSVPDEPGSRSHPAGVASFGLLFQAPEPVVAPRRSRGGDPTQQSGSAAGEADGPSADEGDPEGDRESGGAREPGSGGADAIEAEGTAGVNRRRRGGRGRRGKASQDPMAGEAAGDAEPPEQTERSEHDDTSSDGGADSGSGDDSGGMSSRRHRRRRRSGSSDGESQDPPGTVTKVREPRARTSEPTAVRGSTRLEAKKLRRREGREAGRRRTIITEAEFLARRESVERVMVVRGTAERTQIGVLEDGVLVEHYVSRPSSTSMAGNVYLGRVQNVLPSMEAAFVDIGKGRNAVLYAGEVNWDAAGLEVGQVRRIENALTSGDTVLVQVTKDPIGHKGARLTSQISLPGRFLVYVPEGQMTGISRKLPENERARLKAILKQIVPDSAGVIVRTAAEGASEDDLRADVERLTRDWERIRAKAATASARKSGSGGAPQLIHGEPDLTVRVIRDIFTEDFTSLVVSGDRAWQEVSDYVEDVAPDLAQRLSRWTAEEDVFAHHRIDEQLAKAMDRKVWLPSGGSLVIDRTEAMTVIDVNTGKFVGSGGNLEETVTKNNIEAAEEIVRQLRLRDIGGIIVIDFIDMVLESNRDLVVRRLLECLGRDRTKHQVAEVTSLGLVQMTRKRVGSGLVEAFSEPCTSCSGRGIIVHAEPVTGPGERAESGSSGAKGPAGPSGTARSRGRRGGSGPGQDAARSTVLEAPRSGPTAAQIAAAAHAAAVKRMAPEHTDGDAGHEPEPDLGAPHGEGPAAIEVEPMAEHGPDEVADALRADAGSGSAAEDALPAEPTATPTTDDTGSTEQQPMVPTRRKRGRVVAPAGPPRSVLPPQ